MKRFSFFLPAISTCFLLLVVCLNANANMPVINEPGNSIHSFDAGMKAADLIKISAADFSLMTGKRMNAWQKISFKLMKVILRKELKKNPDLLMKDFYTENKKMATGWIILLAVLSTLLLLLLIFAIAHGKQR